MTNEAQEAIRVCSLDFDGCLYHLALNDAIKRGEATADTEHLIQFNQPFLDTLKAQSSFYKKTVLMIGSNRQDMHREDANSRDRMPCYPSMPVIANYIGAEFDTFLMADIYSNNEAGTAYRLATSEKKYEISHPTWKFEDYKTTILYAQMHKLAVDNPTIKIDFEFYDDREDILENLEQFFTTYPNLIPKNVNLKLSRYFGNEVETKSTIQGVGECDPAFRQTVKDLATICEDQKCIDQRGVYYIVRAFTPERLLAKVNARLSPPIKRKSRLELNDELEELPAAEFFDPETRDEPLVSTRMEIDLNETGKVEIVICDETEEDALLDDINSSVDSYSSIQLEELDEQGKDYVKQLKQASDELLSKVHAFARKKEKHEKYQDAHDAAFGVWKVVSEYAQNYPNLSDSQRQTQGQACVDAIEQARPTLSEHRGLKRILGNIGLCLTLVGVGYLTVKYFKSDTKQFFFNPKTDSVNKLEQAEALLKEQIQTSPSA